MEVPVVLIQWMALHAESDVDLATLSNVSRSWRQHVREAILGSANASSLLLPSMIRYARNKQESSSSLSDSFCAAWFHPDGVQTVQVTSKPIDEDHLHKRQKGGNRDGCYEWRGYRHAVDVLTPFGYAPHFIQSVLVDETAGKYSDTTAAVRGSTYARPEGYCTCWDEEEQEQYNKYSQIIRQQQRTMLQRQMLPRTIKTPRSNNTAIQFLNASGTNAVRLLTAPFSCGPLVHNMTLFIVSVATEDGCFCSGLKRRCEFGHFYPQSNRDHLIDMSSICIATNVVDDDDDDDDGNDSSDDEDDHNNNNGGEKKDDDEDDEDESHDMELRQRSLSLHGACSCPFNPNAELFETAAEHEQDVKPPDALHRGQRGPGQWHVYVAVVDGANATIRVDGATEPMSHLSRDSNNNNSSNGATSGNGNVQLDGLTIGSDHSFDMSLCFGEGGPGEGEGSIAELAVFQGTLPMADIQAMEQHLMSKHGIVPMVPGREDLVRQEDEWKRFSRALIEQGAPYNMVVPEGVPLRVVAKDPSVSWHRTNAVTGDDIRVGRIGSRLSTGSSDW